MHYPALLIVKKRDLLNKQDELPHPEDVMDDLQIIEERSTWFHTGYVMDVRRDSVDIQHEAPPTEPYDAVATVIVLTEMDTSTRAKYSDDPLDELITALYDKYEGIEIWLNTAQIS